MGGPHDGTRMKVSDDLITVAMPVPPTSEAQWPSVARYVRNSYDGLFATFTYTGQESFLW